MSRIPPDSFESDAEADAEALEGIVPANGGIRVTYTPDSDEGIDEYQPEHYADLGFDLNDAEEIQELDFNDAVDQYDKWGTPPQEEDYAQE